MVLRGPSREGQETMVVVACLGAWWTTCTDCIHGKGTRVQRPTVEMLEAGYAGRRSGSGDDYADSVQVGYLVTASTVGLTAMAISSL